MTKAQEVLSEILKQLEKITADEWEQLYLYVLSLEKEISEHQKFIELYAEKYKEIHLEECKEFLDY